MSYAGPNIYDSNYPPSRAPYGYGYPRPHLIGIVLAIIVIVVAIMVIFWLLGAGLTIASQVAASGEKTGFPLGHLIGIIGAIVVLIITVMIAIWLFRVARVATRVAASI